MFKDINNKYKLLHINNDKRNDNQFVYVKNKNNKRTTILYHKFKKLYGIE